MAIEERTSQQLVDRAARKGLSFESHPAQIKQALRFLGQKGEQWVRLARNKYGRA